MKQNLVLLPGLMCDGTVWLHQISALSDLANSLSMEWGPQHDTLVKMAEATLAAAPPRFALAGHSMGGRVAFEVYRLAPERVTRLAVMDTGVTPLPAGEAGVEEERGRRRLLDLAKRQGVRAMAEEWLKGMIPEYRQSDEVLREGIIRMFERKSARFFEAQMLALLARPDARPVLAAVRCPTLVLTGEDDAWSPPAAHQAIAAGIAASPHKVSPKLVIVPRSGHMSTMEQPEAVAAAMREWLLS